MHRPRTNTFPLGSLSLYWLANLTRSANRPDQNLGQSEVSRSLCRITSASTGKLMEAFRHIDSCYARPPDTFIDLGCGRGLVCVSALLDVPELSQVIGVDINEREIDWAHKNILNSPAAEAIVKHKLSLQVGNAVEFCLERDAVVVPALGVGVWVYAFWKDWGEDRRRVARHMLLEDSHLWTVFACSDNSKSLFALVADGDEAMREMLTEAFICVEDVTVSLTASGERHTIYFYIKKT